MNPILLAIVSVVIIGLICAVVLVVASKVMAVEEDPKMGLIRECLPGANCGACGYAGCDGYAKALADGSETRTNLCIPGADAAAHAISDVLGVAAADVVEMVAVVRCNGDCDQTKDKMDYEGPKSCKAAKNFFGGVGACTFGCMGFGDCEAVCPVNAITIEKSLARVDSVACIGCGMCARTCPTGVITTLPRTAKVVVECSSKAKGAVVRKACTAGCIGCTKCQQVCPSDAIHVTNNLAVVDQDKCTGCGTCVENCPVKCIHMVDNFTQWQAAHNLAR
ncbi:MAG TPA: RnfABCDGE type electron transport complex subunit B [Candidatus Galloscillospira stercoripullorum]|nr:RnfABCDGE type electron transport complex subunit B [Candidatus Galloscillospira stercoripullorum]